MVNPQLCFHIEFTTLEIFSVTISQFNGNFRLSRGCFFIQYGHIQLLVSTVIMLMTCLRDYSFLFLLPVLLIPFFQYAPTLLKSLNPLFIIYFHFSGYMFLLYRCYILALFLKKIPSLVPTSSVNSFLLIKKNHFRSLEHAIRTT